MKSSIVFLCLTCLAFGPARAGGMDACRFEDMAAPGVYTNRRESVKLDGDWDFRYFAKAADFNASDGREESGWSKLSVPANWELHGFGSFGYGSNRGKPGEESGLYRTRFATPADFTACRQAFLRFEGVMFGAEVRVNDQDAGSFRSSFNRNTLDVTALLKPAGELNTLEVHTRIRPKGCEFDTNDDWTLHGIFRSVYLDTRPKVHLEDWRVTTHLEGDVARITVEAEATGGGTVEIDCPDQVAPDGLWSAENPVLHTLTFTVRDKSGRVSEIVKAKTGFREITYDGGELKVNGKKVFLKGVNHHDLCPCHGRAVTDEEQWRDAKMIKAAGMNFIRLCHYPPSKAMLEACDELGLYVMDEVPCGFAWYLVQDAAYGEVLNERVRLTIERDKCHPSVLIWSIGNENPTTQVKLDAGRLAFALDPTRPWTFPMTPGTFKEWMERKDNLDVPPVYDWHYMNTGDIPAYTNRVDRPILASEWGHAFGSDTGAVEDIYNLMQAWPSCAGGAIWHFQDQGVARRADTVSERERLESVWLDEQTIYDSHGIAGTDGLVYADRTPQTGWYQICAIFSGKARSAATPARFDLASLASWPARAMPDVSLRFDRRMTISKRSAIDCAKASRGKKRLGKRDLPPKALVEPRIQNAQACEVAVTATNGAYLVTYAFSRAEAWDSAEAGVCFELPPDLTEFRWQGLGPYEAYPKRDRLDDFGVWHLTKQDLYFPGNRPQTAAAIVCDKTGAGWLVLGAEDGETLDVAVEDSSLGGVRLCINAFVCGTYAKRGWPQDMRHIEAGEKIEGAFRLVPLDASWPQSVRDVFGEPDEVVAACRPFLKNYDRIQE